MIFNRLKAAVALGAVLALWYIGSVSHAAVIDFNTAITNGAEGRDFQTGSLYKQAGYTVESTQGAVFFLSRLSSAFPALQQFEGNVLEFNDNRPSIRITRDDGGIFDLFGVLTGSLGRSEFDDGNFIFTGLFENGASVSRTIIGNSNLASYTFNEFNGLRSLSISSSDGYFPVLDNITLSDINAISAPGTFALLSLGVIGLITCRRRRRK